MMSLFFYKNRKTEIILYTVMIMIVRKKPSVSHHSVSIFLIDSAQIWKSNMTFLEDHPPIKRSKEFKGPVDPQDLYSPVDDVSRFCFLQFRDALKLTPKGRGNYLPHFFPLRSF